MSDTTATQIAALEAKIRMLNASNILLSGLLSDAKSADGLDQLHYFAGMEVDELLDLVERHQRDADKIAALEAEVREMALQYLATAGQAHEALDEAERLRLALTFYADESAYETAYETLPCECCTNIYEPVMRDRGNAARAALDPKQ